MIYSNLVQTMSSLCIFTVNFAIKVFFFTQYPSSHEHKITALKQIIFTLIRLKDFFDLVYDKLHSLIKMHRF